MRERVEVVSALFLSRAAFTIAAASWACGKDTPIISDTVKNTARLTEVFICNSYRKMKYRQARRGYSASCRRPVNKFRLNDGEQYGYNDEAYQRGNSHTQGDKAAEFGEYPEPGKGQYGETRAHRYRIDEDCFAAAVKGPAEKTIARAVIAAVALIFMLKGFNEMDCVINAYANRETGDQRGAHVEFYSQKTHNREVAQNRY
jgi:hypothetical protein